MKLKICFFFYFLVLSMVSNLMAATIELPSTGQTNRYNTFDDGDLQKGIPMPSLRFHDNNDDTMTDTLTGLIWPKNAMTINYNGCFPDNETWQAAMQYVECLNKKNYLGFNDWRMPNIRELDSLVNAGQSIPAVWLNTQGFNNFQLDNYCSSTTSASSPNYAWGVAMEYGEVTEFKKSDSPYLCNQIIPVRGIGCGNICIPVTGQKISYFPKDDGDLQFGVPIPKQRFIDNQNGTITDKLTDLVWLQDANLLTHPQCNPNGTYMNWQQALTFVTCLNMNTYLGFDDWRLPNRKELHSLVDYSKYRPALSDTHLFVNGQAKRYWTSTTMESFKAYAWAVNMFDGTITHIPKNINLTFESMHVLPVRGGYSNELQSADIELQQGWNFVSLPLRLFNTAIAEIFKTNLSFVKIIWGYDNKVKKWLFYKPSIANSTLKNMQSGSGYWIYMDRPVTLQISGIVPLNYLQLYSGWNLVGWQGNDYVEPTQALEQMSIKWDAIWTWDGGIGWTAITKLPITLAPPLEALIKTKAYWIRQ